MTVLTTLAFLAVAEVGKRGFKAQAEITTRLLSSFDRKFMRTILRWTVTDDCNGFSYWFPRTFESIGTGDSIFRVL